VVSSIHLGPKTRFLLLSDSYGFVDVGRHLWQEDGSVVYNYCWASPAQSVSGKSPAGLMLSKIRDFSKLEGQVPRSRVTQLYWLCQSQRVTVRLAVYRQSVDIGAKPLETHDQRLFLQLDPCDPSPYVTSSLTRRWIYLLWICLAFRQVYVSHIQHVIENSSFCTKSPVSPGFAKEMIPILRILCYNGSLVT
jgi:hypothetical protein